jgi:BASS family bile acid:Na+ symporter
MRFLSSFATLLTNRNFILTLGIGLGFLLGPRTIIFKDLTPYIIGFILAISLSSFSFHSLKPLKKNIRPVLVCIILNYLVYGTILLVMVRLFTDNPDLWTGFVVIAATPPAIAIIPFSFNLDGDTHFSIIGVFGGNLLGIVITPLIFFLFSGAGLLDPIALIKILVTMLIVPLIVSRAFRHRRIYPYMEKFRGNLIDYGFFMVAMTVIGLSRDLLFSFPGMILIPALILFFVKFVMASLFKLGMRNFIADKKRTISLSLMLTVKNAGFAAVVAISLFDEPKVFLPAAILSVMMPLFYIYESNMGRKFI